MNCEGHTWPCDFVRKISAGYWLTRVLFQEELIASRGRICYFDIIERAASVYWYCTLTMTMYKERKVSIMQKEGSQVEVRKKQFLQDITREKLKFIGEKGVIISNVFIFLALLPGGFWWFVIAGISWTLSLSMLIIGQKNKLIKAVFAGLILLIWTGIYKLYLL